MGTANCPVFQSTEECPHAQSLNEQLSREQQIAALEKDWATNPRWKGVKRGYSAADVVRLRGSLPIEYTLAKRGAEKLWDKVNGGAKKGYVNAFGAISAGQAMQQAKAGLEAVYLSGWQVAADGNTSETMYPDQSLYAYDSVPTMVRRINNTFKRADEIQWGRGINPGDKEFIDYFLPIVADAEAGFGGVLNAFELMKNMIAAGAAGVHFEDQLAAVKKCGHMGGKVLVPTQEACEKLIAARFAADVMGVPTIVLARTDAEAANLITSDHDANDKPFLTGERTQEGFYRVKNGLEQAISRGVAYAPYADLVWCETGVPTSASPVNSPRLCTPPAPASCCRTTARHRSTGRRTSTTRRSLPSRKSCPHWATSTSSSRWPASTSTGSTPSSSPTPTLAAKA
jgi:isocitrate lyase